jgi:hypothetical protein
MTDASESDLLSFAIVDPVFFHQPGCCFISCVSLADPERRT